MGDPKLRKKTFRGPSHPWQKERILEEAELLRTYGIKNKRELWKAGSLLKKFMRQAKEIIASHGAQADIQKQHLLSKLASYGLISKTAQIEDVLNIALKDILNRRLQTIAFKKNLARTVRQARQFIVHEHITVGDDKITLPSFLVSLEQEPLIAFAANSSFGKADHPERTPLGPRKEKRRAPRRDSGRRGSRDRGGRRMGGQRAEVRRR
ncbi:30S ribosomal protein S4 [Candidatus Woesearchaeota archaeon]|nr:30S ribosomal protein S4 [Candidatus Woesearchaeota archaeon]